jgi:galactokinase
MGVVGVRAGQRRRMAVAENERVYERYIALSNAQDFGKLGEVVDP